MIYVTLWQVRFVQATRVAAADASGVLLQQVDRCL
jgi:hypothetical protein